MRKLVSDSPGRLRLGLCGASLQPGQHKQELALPHAKREGSMKHITSYLWCAVVLLPSFCGSQPVTSDYVWAIVKVSYDPKAGKAEGGSCGTVFFVNDTTFVTAHHLANSALFRPNAGYPYVRVFLANSRGDTIDDFRIVQQEPDYDLAIGRIVGSHPAIQVCPLQTQIARGEKVYNIGFPTDQVFEYSLAFEGSTLVVQRIRMKPIRQEGLVQDIRKVTVRSNDVNIQDETVAVLDYSSRIGFSGGPLVSSSSGKVVGLMSLVIPKEFDPRRPAVAIRMSDIEPLLEKWGQPRDAGDKK